MSNLSWKKAHSKKTYEFNQRWCEIAPSIVDAEEFMADFNKLTDKQKFEWITFQLACLLSRMDIRGI